MDSDDLRRIATDPLVQLCFYYQDTHCFAFARYFMAMQMKHTEPLNLREILERYITSSYREIATDLESEGSNVLGIERRPERAEPEVTVTR